MEDFKRKGSKDYRYMHRVLTHTANNQEDGWQPWSISERVDVGMRLLDIILRTTDLVEKKDYYNKGKHIVTLEPTEQALEFVRKYDEVAELMHPRTMPCIIQPDDWTDLDQGGYYSPELRSHTKLVLVRDRWHRKVIRKQIASGGMAQVIDAVNTAQHVPWKVNKRVLDVARTVWAKNLAIGMPASEKLEPAPSPFPEIDKEKMSDEQKAVFLEWKRHASETYTKERERQGKGFQTASIMRAANEYAAHPAFWFVWTMDFRGRMYTTTSGFSPQGPDLAKGMLLFRDGVRLGVRGVYWLKVHGANRFGYDKVNFDDRVKWVDERHDWFMKAAASPLDHVDVWAKADKPYQFLAFLFEYYEMMTGKLVGQKPEDYISYLPIGLDGSCNGLQHFSAMFRDERGGRATNLVPQPIPSDIYREVADVCLVKIKHAATADALMKQWTTFANQYGDGKLPRKVSKRPVMTLPYGSTRQSCTEYIYDAAQEYTQDQPHFVLDGLNSTFKAATALTPLMWTSIGEVVVAARLGMDWLKKCASLMSKKSLGISWRTKDGFVVHMYEREKEVVRIETVLAGRYQARVGNHTDTLNKHGQRNGIAPNFVHSQDAAHLRATILKAREAGITSLALIHDDYGTHAGNTDTLHRLIRESFVEQYEQFDPIKSFKEWQEAISQQTMPDAPEYGSLDIRQVLNSQFFFS
jgi:DNA-directed RNA polymerase